LEYGFDIFYVLNDVSDHTVLTFYNGFFEK
jgi:hypothetical protein